jgi:ferric-dicitrate binding protein FerR (iron transport regulator)
MEDKYKHYSVEDFAADDQFIRWVKHPDIHSHAAWQQWLLENPERQHIIDEAKALVKSVEFDAYPRLRSSANEVWQRIRNTNTEQYTTESQFIPEESNTTPVRWWRWAAVLTGFLLMAGVILYTLREQPKEFHTAFGQTKEVHLPDGSTVTLNANSTLRLGQWDNNREVWLKGEAFFSVRKQQSKSVSPKAVKFIVHAGEVDVSVLGTEFMVSDHQVTTIVLNEGKIQLTHHDQHIMMKPGELVEITPGQQNAVKRNVNPAVYSSWKNNEWILDGITLKEIAKRLEDTYGMKVLIKKNPDPATKVTGVVPTDNLEKLLTALSAVFELNFKRKGNEIVIE